MCWCVLVCVGMWWCVYVCVCVCLALPTVPAYKDVVAPAAPYHSNAHIWKQHGMCAWSPRTEAATIVADLLAASL